MLVFTLALIPIVLLLSYSKYTSVTSAPTMMGFLATLIPILLWGSAKYAKIIAVLSGIIIIVVIGSGIINPSADDLFGYSWLNMSLILTFIVFPAFILSFIFIFVNRSILSLVNNDLLMRLNSGKKNLV